MKTLHHKLLFPIIKREWKPVLCAEANLTRSLNCKPIWGITFGRRIRNWFVVEILVFMVYSFREISNYKVAPHVEVINFRMTCRQCICDLCNRAFKRKDFLKSHQEWSHSERRLFKCTMHKCGQCSKAFKSKWNLKLHQRVHTDIRPYECADCEMRFKSKPDLKQH